MSGEFLDTKKYKYRRFRVRGPDGKVRYTAMGNDAISRAMFGIVRPQELMEIAEENGLDRPRFREHSSKNAGHFKMIVAQALRDRVKKGRTVYIGRHVIRTLDQAVALPTGFVEMPEFVLPKSLPRKTLINRNKR